MAADGKLFILVNVAQHRDKMGEICNRLVSDYGVPLSIIDDIQKICPKCLKSPHSKTDNTTVSTTTGIQSFNLDDFRHHDDQKFNLKLTPQSTTKVFPQTIQKTTPVTFSQKTAPVPLKTVLPLPPPKPAPILTKVLPLPPKPNPITLRVVSAAAPPKMMSMPSKLTNGNHHPSQATVTTQMVVVKRKESPPIREMVTEPKKIKIEEPPIIKQEEFAFDDEEIEDDNDVLGTVLKALQNGNTDLGFNGSGASSDDGASNSSNMYDGEDDDYKGTWNPDFLTNFITSQPAIFSATTQESTRSQSKVGSQVYNGKRVVPPMLTVNGKTRRGRIVYTTNELDILEKYYEEDPNACADPTKREKMCKTLSIDYHRLKVWFQNRRRKDKVKSSSQEDSIFNLNDLDNSQEA